jgi:predicted AlkP superfamily phosphohydrolase/phosphomutase
MRRKIVLYELNEVPWRVLDQFAAWRPTSYLARVLPVMRRFGTFAEDRSDLSPWITWPTLHRGVTDERHGILSFGQDLTAADREYPPIWELLARAGVSVGVCGSLHTYPLPPAVDRYRFFIPDAFAAGAECFPETISTFQAFNLDMGGRSGTPRPTTIS